ncbi:hypothetical protein PENSPDRAFT_342331 [Peniophora sp. CONT]|nr:hypothetical protein PENSPDRAFT_342331 [Peniophora sp. CONT]
MDGERMDEWAASWNNRLPTFTEVLSRRTRPPGDLFMFYLFLQREGNEDILDFWLDVQQHENLRRAHFKDVLLGRLRSSPEVRPFPVLTSSLARNALGCATFLPLVPHQETRATRSTSRPPSVSQRQVARRPMCERPSDYGRGSRRYCPCRLNMPHPIPSCNSGP